MRKFLAILLVSRVLWVSKSGGGGGSVGGRQGGDSPRGSKPKRVVVRRGKTTGKGQTKNQKYGTIKGGDPKPKKARAPKPARGGTADPRGGAAAGLDRHG
jgi:hypothetical protein